MNCPKIAISHRIKFKKNSGQEKYIPEGKSQDIYF